MLRKMFSVGALFVVAVTFGVSTASAAKFKPISPNANYGGEGFSDGRFR
jgi:hypothetical protein